VRIVDKDKNIMFIIQALSNGGAERIMSYLTQGFSGAENKYLVVYHLSESEYKYDGVLINLDIKPSRHKIVKVINYFRRIFKLRKLKRELNIDKAISLLDSPNIVNILSKGREQVVISIRNHKSEEINGVQKKLYKYLARYLYNKADNIVAISEGVKEDLVNNYSVKGEKVKVIYNPVNIQYVDSIKNEEIEEKYKDIFEGPVVINSGRLSQQKGQWHLIRAFSEVVKIIPEAKLVILGKGAMEDYLRGLINKLNLEKNVFLLGFQNNPFKYISKCKLFVLSSLFEGFGNVIVEAMACGSVVISTDCKSGPREILAPGTDINSEITAAERMQYGVLVPRLSGIQYSFEAPLDNEENILAESIITMLSDEQLLENYREKAAEGLKNFDYNAIINKWQEL
jgi:glycosyltransferase involved in cell wall biosynthesis